MSRHLNIDNGTLREEQNKNLTGLHTVIQQEAPWLKKVIVIIYHLMNDVMV